jgi:hypothetical protein
VNLVHELGRVESMRYEGEDCLLEAEVAQSLLARLSEYLF